MIEHSLPHFQLTMLTPGGSIYVSPVIPALSEAALRTTASICWPASKILHIEQITPFAPTLNATPA